MLVLSSKFKDFLTVQADREYLEGTTAAGKTTVGIFKFMLMVAKSDIKYHVLAGADIGTVEKNVINSEPGVAGAVGRTGNVQSKRQRQNKTATH